MADNLTSSPAQPHQNDLIANKNVDETPTSKINNQTTLINNNNNDTNTSNNNSNNSSKLKINKPTPLIDGPVRTHRLYVGGVPRSVTEDDLRQYFQRFGRIYSCFLKESKVTNKSRGFGFFVVDESVVASIFRSAPHFVKGREVFVKEAFPTGSSRIPRPQYRRVFVGGLPQEICEWDLLQLFSRFGRVESVQIFWDKARSKFNDDDDFGLDDLCRPDLISEQRSRRHRGFGFVTFVDNLYAEAVVRQRYFFLESGVWINEASRLIETRMASSNYANRYASTSSCSSSGSLSTSSNISSSNISSSTDSLDEMSEDRRVVVMSPPILYPQLHGALQNYGFIESIVCLRPGFAIVTFRHIPDAKKIDKRGYFPLDAFRMATVELFRKRGLRLPWPRVAPHTPNLSPVDSLSFWDDGHSSAQLSTIPTIPPPPLQSLHQAPSAISSCAPIQPIGQISDLHHHIPQVIHASNIHVPTPSSYQQHHLATAPHLQHHASAMNSPLQNGSILLQQTPNIASFNHASVFSRANLNAFARVFVPPSVEQLQDCSTCPQHGSSSSSSSADSILTSPQPQEIPSEVAISKEFNAPSSSSPSSSSSVVSKRRLRVAGD